MNKVTEAKTQYRQIRQFDLDWILEQCKDIVAVTKGLTAEYKSIKEDLEKPRVLLPKLSTGGRNSAFSMCEGVVENFSKGQYNLTDKQCDGLVEAFRVANEYYEVDTVEFDEVVNLPKLPLKSPKVTEMPTSTIGDFFDIESITVTYRKK